MKPSPIRYANILVPVDFSPHSRNAIELAARLAATWEAKLTLLVVNEASQMYMGFEDDGRAAKHLAQELDFNLRAAVEKHVPEGIETVTLQREGYAAEEIVHQCEEGDHDLIVMGTHGRTGNKRALVGSVTERVIGQVPVPVMVTP